MYGNDIDAMTFDRGFMHSILFGFLGAYLFVWITYQLCNKGKRLEMTTLKDWILLYFLSIFTFAILDSFTPYGTQLFAPFFDCRSAFNYIYESDPADVNFFNLFNRSNVLQVITN